MVKYDQKGVLNEVRFQDTRSSCCSKLQQRNITGESLIDNHRNLTSHCPSVSNNWKPVSHTPGSVSMWTSTQWLGLSHSSFFILPTLLRRPRDSPPSPPPRTGRMVLISRSVSRYGPTHLVRSPPHLLPHLCRRGERENIRHSLLLYHFLGNFMFIPSIKEASSSAIRCCTLQF